MSIQSLLLGSTAALAAASFAQRLTLLLPPSQSRLNTSVFATRTAPATSSFRARKLASRSGVRSVRNGNGMTRIIPAAALGPNGTPALS